ncbi:MAG TPA: PLP-dependent aminotransferase family protein [Gemmatimonadaceae bacterium]|nr:PLP-dependent aminotransferase family protein [Gemmatimonadaceae bacterium]
MPPRARRGRILAVAIDQKSGQPLYRQIYSHVRQCILDGRLAPGARLPSTRQLAADLRVSRSTAVQAYEQLRAEGYIEGLGGAETRVSGALPDSFVRTGPRDADPQTMPLRSSLVPSTRARATLAAMRRATTPFGLGPRAFRAGVPAVDVFPVDTWGRIMARRWSRTPARDLAYGEPFGYRPLREAIADYLRAARGVRCTADQVMVVAGSQQGLDLAARVLLDPADKVWLEDPGYHGARGAFTAAGATIIPVPVDQDGLDVMAGRTLAPDARLAFVTPSRQLPLGSTMSLPRRLALLEWAAASRAAIFEDDYDSEFRYASRPLPALQGLDRAGCVLYAGTFSKVTFPSMRLGYLVVPPSLIDVFGAARHFMDFHSPFLEQAVMTDFIVEGHFERHIRRMRAIYHERQVLLVNMARERLGGLLDVRPADAGMTVVGWLGGGLDDVATARAAERAGLHVLPLSPLSVRPIPPALLLGYAGVRDDEIRDGVNRLAIVLEQAIRNRPPNESGHHLMVNSVA